MDFGRRALAALGKVGIVVAVLVAFLFGMLGTVYLSLHTAEVKVPDVLGKDRFTAETLLGDAGLKLRVRGARPTADKPDTVLSQLPESGFTVKTGIEVAVEVSRAPKEGESVRSSTNEVQQEEQAKPAENSNANQASTATNQNQNQNQNKPPKNKNTNKNANNSNNKNANNSNSANRNNNANRNANNGNANATRNTNNRNTTPNANRTTNNSNTNRRPSPTTTPSGANRGTP